MKTKIRVSVAAAFVFAAVLMTGCGKVVESWAYIHDPQTEILALYDNGRAVYKGSDYKYTKDDRYIVLTDKAGTETKLRYVPDGDKMLLYERSVYTYGGEGTPDSVVGAWGQDNGWSYEFTDKGTFSEESIFFGHYTVDENEHTIKLMYDDPIEDAILYYSLDGNELTVDYPWPMVPTGSGS